MQNVTQLRQLNKVRTDFIATISHEFNTPLTSILMGASMMVNENIGTLNYDQKSILKTIREDGERLASLVNDLLELSRIESGRSVFKKVPFPIDSAIVSSIKLYYNQAKQKNINLYYEVDDGSPIDL